MLVVLLGIENLKIKYKYNLKKKCKELHSYWILNETFEAYVFVLISLLYRWFTIMKLQ